MVGIKASCQHLIKFMLKFELVQTDKHLAISE